MPVSYGGIAHDGQAALLPVPPFGQRTVFWRNIRLFPDFEET